MENSMSELLPSADDFLPLARLYARFDAIASGRAPSDGVDSHRAVLDRLAHTRRRAEALGWTDCALERLGGGGRLVARGLRPDGLAREELPDWIPGRDGAPDRVAWAQPHSADSRTDSAGGPS
jgi:hypothetical protein